MAALNIASVTHVSECRGGSRSFANWLYDMTMHWHEYILFDAR